jgi:hypothetical protein
MRDEFPTETGLHTIADTLDALQNGYKLLTGHRINAIITQEDNRYCHKYAMGIDSEDSETGEPVDLELETKILELMRDFAEWIYRSLQAEWDYRLSNESIEETIRINEYKFNAATGKVV